MDRVRSFGCNPHRGRGGLPPGGHLPGYSSKESGEIQGIGAQRARASIIPSCQTGLGAKYPRPLLWKLNRVNDALLFAAGKFFWAYAGTFDLSRRINEVGWIPR